MLLACMICMGMSTSGVKIGTIPTKRDLQQIQREKPMLAPSALSDACRIKAVCYEAGLLVTLNLKPVLPTGTITFPRLIASMTLGSA